jgi:hypothetical protein
MIPFWVQEKNRFGNEYKKAYYILSYTTEMSCQMREKNVLSCTVYSYESIVDARTVSWNSMLHLKSEISDEENSLMRWKEIWRRRYP